MIKEMIRYGLLPSDALLVSTCRVHGIKVVITLDEDFKKVDFLKVEIPV